MKKFTSIAGAIAILGSAISVAVLNSKTHSNENHILYKTPKLGNKNSYYLSNKQKITLLISLFKNSSIIGENLVIKNKEIFKKDLISEKINNDIINLYLSSKINAGIYSYFTGNKITNFSKNQLSGVYKLINLDAVWSWESHTHSYDGGKYKSVIYFNPWTVWLGYWGVEVNHNLAQEIKLAATGGSGAASIVKIILEEILGEIPIIGQILVASITLLIGLYSGTMDEDRGNGVYWEMETLVVTISRPSNYDWDSIPNE